MLAALVVVFAFSPTVSRPLWAMSGRLASTVSMGPAELPVGRAVLLAFGAARTAAATKADMLEALRANDAKREAVLDAALAAIDGIFESNYVLTCDTSAKSALEPHRNLT